MPSEIDRISLSGKPDKITTEQFVLFNLAFVFLIAVAVNLAHYFPQFGPAAKVPPGTQAASGSVATQTSGWEGGAFRKQLEQEQQDFIDQIERMDVSDQLDSASHLQQPLTKQVINQNPAKATLQENCYSTCQMQDNRNSQYCQSHCTY